MMNPQTAAQQQAQYQGQVPPQFQGVGQQRQAPNGQQQNYGQVPLKGGQGQQQLQNQYANYDPPLVFFTLEKPKNAKSWEDVQPEQQYIPIQDLQNTLNKFRRDRGNVKRLLNEIPSANCRRLINELVEDQNNNELWKYNRSLRYTIAYVEIEWRSVNRRERQLKRVSIILETEPSGFQEPLQVKSATIGAGNAYAVQDPNKAMKQNSTPQSQQQFQGQPNTSAQNMGQQSIRNNQPQQHQPQPMGNMQHPDQLPMRPPPPPGQGQGQGQGQMHPHANAPPPPPPPPPPPAGHPGMGIPPPPPPPPGGGHAMHGPPTQHPQVQNLPPQSRGPMPGTFPEPMPVPGMRQGMRPGQMPPQVMDPGFLRGQKLSNHKGRGGSSSSSESEWESESGSSGSEPIRVCEVEDDYVRVGRRERGRSCHSTKPQQLPKHRPHSKAKSRSRSRSHVRRFVDSDLEKSSRRRRDSGLIDPSPIGRYSLASSKSNSPNLPPIHIHMSTNTTNTADDRAREHDQLRDRRAGLNSSPTGFYKAKGKLEKTNTSQPMSRDSSWDRASGTASFSNSSTHTTEDAIFDAPMRRPSLSHNHSRTQTYSRPQEGLSHPHPSHIYDDVDRRPRIRHLPADDYPHNLNPRMRDSYFETQSYGGRPNLSHRHTSAQVPSGNPFATLHYPPKPMRASSYAADMHEPGYTYPPQRYVADRAEQDERVHLRDLADAIEHIKESKNRRPLGRPHSDIRDSAMYSGDEWDTGYPSSRSRAYAGYPY